MESRSSSKKSSKGEISSKMSSQNANLSSEKSSKISSKNEFLSSKPSSKDENLSSKNDVLSSKMSSKNEFLSSKPSSKDENLSSKNDVLSSKRLAETSSKLISKLSDARRHSIEDAKKKGVPMKALLHAAALFLSDDLDDWTAATDTIYSFTSPFGLKQLQT